MTSHCYGVTQPPTQLVSISFWAGCRTNCLVWPRDFRQKEPWLSSLVSSSYSYAYFNGNIFQVKDVVSFFSLFSYSPSSSSSYTTSVSLTLLLPLLHTSARGVVAAFNLLFHFLVFLIVIGVSISFIALSAWILPYKYWSKMTQEGVLLLNIFTGVIQSLAHDCTANWPHH